MNFRKGTFCFHGKQYKGYIHKHFFETFSDVYVSIVKISFQLKQPFRAAIQELNEGSLPPPPPPLSPELATSLTYFMTSLGLNLVGGKVFQSVFFVYKWHLYEFPSSSIIHNLAAVG